MNNSKITSTYSEAPEPGQDSKAGELEVVIDAIRSVKNFGPYKLFKEKVLDPAIKIAEARLVEEKDEKEMYRLQGFVVSSKKFSNLDNLETFYQQQLIQIKKGRNKEEE